MLSTTEPNILLNLIARNTPKIIKITSLYLKNHLIINSNDLDLDFYIHSIASIKVI
jgi:hypothetical protein